MHFASLDEAVRRRTRRLASLALAIAEMAGLAALLLAPNFAVRSVEVSGNTRLTNDQVLAVAHVGDGCRPPPGCGRPRSVPSCSTG